MYNSIRWSAHIPLMVENTSKTKRKSNIFCSPTHLHFSEKNNAYSAFLPQGTFISGKQRDLWCSGLACPRAYGNVRQPLDECKDLMWSEKNQLASAAWKLTGEDEKQVFKSSSDDLKSWQLQKHEAQPGGKTFNFARLY